jgi:hypothetical protein
MGGAIPWFRGSPEEFEAAKIKSDRSLAALGQMGAGAGRVLGAYRQGQDDATKAAQQDAYLNSVLGTQAQKATTQSDAAGSAGSSLDVPGGATGTSPTNTTPPSQEETTLQRIARKTSDFGLAALRAGGAAIGVASPDSPDTQALRLKNAGRQGQVARESMDNKRLGVLAPYAEHTTANLGDFIGRATGGRLDMGSLPVKPPERQPSYYSDLAAEGRFLHPDDPAAAREWTLSHDEEFQVNRTQPAGAYAPPGDKYGEDAVSDLYREWQQNHPGDMRTYKDIAPTFSPQEVQDRANQLQQQQDPAKAYTNSLMRGLLPGTTPTPSQQPPGQASGKGGKLPMTSARTQALANTLARLVDRYKETGGKEGLTEEEAIKQLKEAQSGVGGHQGE